MNTSNFKENPKSILDLSKRTVLKIARRARLKCSICGWGNATCDIHHITPRSKGGTNDMENLISLCPNCHREAHQFKDKFKTKEQLMEVSLDKTFPNWRDYYNPKKPICENFSDKDKLTKRCLTCNKVIPWDNLYCSIDCSQKTSSIPPFSETQILNWIKNNLSIRDVAKSLGVNHATIYRKLKAQCLLDFYIQNRTKNKKPKSLYVQKKCENKPSKEELSFLVSKLPVTHIAKQFGVSGNAVAKWCKKYNIATHPRGYWSKLI